jgi:GGDEF domain-containing protein
MRTIEAQVYGRGFAYRQGGDEYLALLVNSSAEIAGSIFNELRHKVSELDFLDICLDAIVSIGFCLVDSHCYLTEAEILDKATKAAAYAKDQGKDCVATYKGDRFQETDLYLISKS